MDISNVTFNCIYYLLNHTEWHKVNYTQQTMFTLNKSLPYVICIAMQVFAFITNAQMMSSNNLRQTSPHITVAWSTFFKMSTVYVTFFLRVWFFHSEGDSIHSNCCPEVGAKTLETVAQLRQKANDLFHNGGNYK
jgi:hypothetical protein